MTANILLMSFKNVQIFMFLFCLCIYLVLCNFCQTLWLTLKHLVTEEFFSPLVTDGQFEWTSPFLTRRDWASEDDEWGCFKMSFSSVSPSLRFPPCMRRRNAELTDFYAPIISKWRNSFNQNLTTVNWIIIPWTRSEAICVFSILEDISLKTEIML